MPSGIVEQSRVGMAHPAVQHGGEAVLRKVDHAPALRHRLPDEALDERAIGQVVLRDDLRAQRGRCAARRRREKLRMTHRAIEVDEEATDGGTHQRCAKSPGQLPGHDQRTGIIPTVGVEQRSPPPKQRLIGRGYPVAAMFTGYEVAVGRHGRSPVQVAQAAVCPSRSVAPYFPARWERERPVPFAGIWPSTSATRLI